MVISSCSLAEARLLLDNFLKASIDKVGQLLTSGEGWGGQGCSPRLTGASILCHPGVGVRVMYRRAPPV